MTIIIVPDGQGDHIVREITRDFVTSRRVSSDSDTPMYQGSQPSGGEEQRDAPDRMYQDTNGDSREESYDARTSGKPSVAISKSYDSRADQHNQEQAEK